MFLLCFRQEQIYCWTTVPKQSLVWSWIKSRKNLDALKIVCAQWAVEKDNVFVKEVTKGLVENVQVSLKDEFLN